VIYFIYMEMGEREDSGLSTRQQTSCHVHVDLLGELNYCKERETGRVSPRGSVYMHRRRNRLDVAEKATACSVLGSPRPGA
jgi:hypothetical protein